MDEPLNIDFQGGYINVRKLDKEMRWSYWLAKTVRDITAEKGDTIEAFKFRMTITDRG